MKNTVNSRIKLLRTSLRLTQNEFASELKISPSLVSKIEAGEKPSSGTIDTIITTYNVPEEWLVNGKGELAYVKPVKEISDNPWKNVAFQEKAKEVENLKSEVKNLWSMIDDFRNGRLSFLLPVSQRTGT